MDRAGSLEVPAGAGGFCCRESALSADSLASAPIDGFQNLVLQSLKELHATLNAVQESQTRIEDGMQTHANSWQAQESNQQLPISPPPGEENSAPKFTLVVPRHDLMDDEAVASTGAGTTSNVTSRASKKQKKTHFGRKHNWMCKECEETNQMDEEVCIFCGGLQPKLNLVEHTVQHPLFDVFCGIVILCNAVTIAITSQSNLQWVLDNPGRDKLEVEVWEVALSAFYMIFYSIELSFRIYVWGTRVFFTGEDWHWNLFDFVLVVLTVYENVFASFLTSFVTINVSWLRVLRLLKMMKIFRVVRLMRFFRMLRLMVTQIAGSFMMLFWAGVLCFLMIFLFALCFVHGVTEYLLSTPRIDIPTKTWEGISLNWSSLGQAMISLYMSLIGGVDLPTIGEPLKGASDLYYAIFLFYVGFSFISVVNVVSSLYVDSALKISEQDESAVQEALAEREQVTTLLELYKSKDATGMGLISWINFKSSLETLEMKRFMQSLGITLVEVKKVFKLLQHNANVDIEEFVVACMKVVGDTRNLDIVQLHGEARRNTHQMGELFEYFEDRFKTLLAACTHPAGAQQFDPTQSNRLREDLKHVTRGSKLPCTAFYRQATREQVVE